MKKNGLISALIIAVVLLAGCGGGNNSQTTSAAPAETTAAPSATETQVTTPVQTTAETTTVAETPAPMETPAAADNISVEDAKRIAFEDAGANEIDVVLKKASLDTDEGVLEYEVDFFFNDTEYSYDIDPDTGNILDFEAEFDD